MSRQRGFTLVELLVAMALAMTVMGSVLGVLLSARQHLVFIREAAQLQESARFLLEYLSEQIRAAGFNGCSKSLEIESNGATSWYYAVPGVGGYDYDAGRASFPAEFRSAVRAGHDALVLRYGEPTTAAALQQGQATLAMAADCSSGELGTWGSTGFGAGASSDLLGLESAAFYIGTSNAASGLPALFRERLALNSSTHVLYTVAEELVPGVESLQLTYGIDGDDDGKVDHYLNANAIADWQQVGSVHLTLRLRSIASVYPQARSVPPLNGGASSSDRHLHQVFSTTVALRNRL